MIKFFSGVICGAVLFGGFLLLTSPERNTPEAQAEDYKKCTAAGMGASISYYDERIICIPKENKSDEYEHIKELLDRMENM